MAVFPQRGAPETWYPAGCDGVAARTLTLPDGDHARVVEAATSAAPIARVLLLHGWGCNAFHFRKVLPALAARGVYAVALDLRGHGLSHKPADAAAYSAPRLTGFVQNVVRMLDVGPVGVVGHSLGAAIALDLAVAAPSSVSWLTLLSPVGLVPLHATALLKWLPIGLAERMPDSLTRLIGWIALRTAYGRIARPEPGDQEQYLFPNLLPGGRFGTMAYARAFAFAPRADDELARVSCPIHVLLGEYDRVVRAAPVSKHLQRMPGIRVEIVPGAGHVLAEEVPEIVADAVLQGAEAVSRSRAHPNDASRVPSATR